jgi:TonB family protein
MTEEGMKKTTTALAALAALTILAGTAWSQGGGGVVKLCVFQGSREGALEPVKAVTVSYLSYVVAANIQSEADQAAQAARIKGVFNLKEVSLLTEAELSWAPGKADKAFHFFQLDKTFYLVMVVPVSMGQRRFRIEVFEQNGGAKTSLLDTEFSLPERNFAVFGFSDKAGQPYFLSLQPVSLPLSEGNVVRAVGNIQAPQLIKQVEPVYPEAALKAKVGGTVILEAQTDIYGRVQNTKILRSIPLLDQAARDAVRQWVYAPLLIDGKPRPVVFTVTVRFDPENKSSSVGVKGGVVGGVVGGVEGAADVPVRVLGALRPPRLIKEVAPVYPPEARQAGVEGMVILEAQTDVYGRVQSTKILRSIPQLDQAAEEAVRQWVYEPMLINGKPRSAVFTVTVRFTVK